MKQIWMPIKGFKWYLVSQKGNVKSRSRWVRNGYGSKRLVKSRILKFGIDGPGYPLVILRKHQKSYPRRLHKLVAQAFIPNPENKGYVNHKDGNKANPNMDNLEWVTKSEDMLHAIHVLGHRWNYSAMAFKGGTARARNLTKKQIQEIGSKGYKAMRTKMSVEEWKQHQSKAGKVGGKARATKAAAKRSGKPGLVKMCLEVCENKDD